MEELTPDDSEEEPIVFTHEEDGSITARDLKTGLVSGADTRWQALRYLSEVLELHAGGGEPVTDEWLREHGIDPDGISQGSEELPEFMK
jgi:hypothetical protein